MNNQLHNCKNPWQGDMKKVLCVCSAGLLRSPTTAKLLADVHGYNTRACGIDIDHALIPISETLMFWADEIICMEERQRQEIERLLGVFNEKMLYLPDHTPLVYTLEVPDQYGYMDPNLQEFILEAYEEVLKNEQEETISEQEMAQS